MKVIQIYLRIFLIQTSDNLVRSSLPSPQSKPYLQSRLNYREDNDEIVVFEQEEDDRRNYRISPHSSSLLPEIIEETNRGCTKVILLFLSTALCALLLVYIP